MGDSDIVLEKTSQIEVRRGEVTLDKLATVQEKTTVLVHLCNLRGGRISWESISLLSQQLNRYSLYWTERLKKKKYIREYFERFNRYYFCDNDCARSILSAMNQIETDIADGRKWRPVTQYFTLRQLLSSCCK